MSFVPAWIITVVIPGLLVMSSAALVVMSRTVAPGKQHVNAERDRTFRMMESPITRVVGCRRCGSPGGAGLLPLDELGRSGARCPAAPERRAEAPAGPDGRRLGGARTGLAGGSRPLGGILFSFPSASNLFPS